MRTALRRPSPELASTPRTELSENDPLPAPIRRPRCARSALGRPRSDPPSRSNQAFKLKPSHDSKPAYHTQRIYAQLRVASTTISHTHKKLAMDHLGRLDGPRAQTRSCCALRGASAHTRRSAPRFRSSGRPSRPRRWDLGQLLPSSTAGSTCLSESRSAWVASAVVLRWQRLPRAVAAAQAVCSPMSIVVPAEYDMPGGPLHRRNRPI